MGVYVLNLPKQARATQLYGGVMAMQRAHENNSNTYRALVNAYASARTPDQANAISRKMQALAGQAGFTQDPLTGEVVATPAWSANQGVPNTQAPIWQANYDKANVLNHLAGAAGRSQAAATNALYRAKILRDQGVPDNENPYLTKYREAEYQNRNVSQYMKNLVEKSPKKINFNDYNWVYGYGAMLPNAPQGVKVTGGGNTGGGNTGGGNTGGGNTGGGNTGGGNTGGGNTGQPYAGPMSPGWAPQPTPFANSPWGSLIGTGRQPQGSPPPYRGPLAPGGGNTGGGNPGQPYAGPMSPGWAPQPTPFANSPWGSLTGPGRQPAPVPPRI